VAPRCWAGRVEVPDVVDGRVVAGDAVADGEVQARDAGVLEHGEVGAVAEAPGDLVEDGGRHGMRRGVRERLHEPSVPRAGLEHERRPAHAAGLEVEHEAQVAGPRVLRDEGLRADHADLLGVREDEDHVVARGGAAPQGPEGLEQHGHAARVVGRAGGEGDRVVVGDEGQRLGVRLAGQPRHDVPHPGRGERQAPAGGEPGRLLHLGLDAEPPQLGEDVLPGGAVAGRSRGARRRGDRLHVDHGSRRGERAGGRIGGERVGRRQGDDLERGEQPQEGARAQAEPPRQHRSRFPRTRAIAPILPPRRGA
jgi:hypothetical protein